MIRNTRDLVHLLKVSASGLVLIGAGIAGLFLSKALKRRKKYLRDFDPDSKEEIQGQIKEIKYEPDDKESVNGVAFVVESGEREVPVHLGPAWFVNRQFKRFKEGEEVSVNGSNIRYNGQDILVVETLRRGKKQYRLRDEEGAPFWDARISE